MKGLNVDVAVIGAGTAGLSALSEIKKETDDFVLINGGPYGTTCARVGCMPSKVFIQAAHDFYRRHSFEDQGIKNGDQLSFNRAQALKHVRSLRDYFVDGVLKSVKKLGDKNIKGYARFVEPHVLDVDGRKITARNIVIATGSSPVVPKSWLDYNDKIFTTDDIFEQHDLSDTIGVIGAGVIGLELGQALSRIGIHVTMAEGAGFIGGLSDPIINDYAIKTMREEFELHLGRQAEFSLGEKGFSMSCGQDQCMIDKALVSVGRKQNIQDLGLDDIGIALNDQGLPDVDVNTLKINGAPIFMAGDVNGHRPILHESADEGRIAGYNAARKDSQCFKRRTPLTITFTEPQIVIAGKSFQEVEKNPHIIGEVTFDNQGRSRVMHKNKGILRIYAEPKEGRILGAEMIAPHGEYIGHLLAWSIQKDLTAFDVLNMPFYHPTVLEGLRTAVRDLASKVKTSAPNLELAPCDSLSGECFN